MPPPLQRQLYGEERRRRVWAWLPGADASEVGFGSGFLLLFLALHFRLSIDPGQTFQGSSPGLLSAGCDLPPAGFRACPHAGAGREERGERAIANPAWFPREGALPELAPVAVMGCCY